MSHLTEQELSAMLDEALAPEARARLEAHLESCDACRAALADLAGQDRSLAAAIAHDPGDAYFESFAERIEQRIRAAASDAEQAPQREAAATGSGGRPRNGGFGWPRSLGWMGAAAVVLVGAGVAFIVSREGGAPNLRDAALSQRAEQKDAPRAAEPRPVEPHARADEAIADRPRSGVDDDRTPRPGEEAQGAAPLTAALESTGPRAENEAMRPAPQGRLQEVVRDEQGDELPARRAGDATFATPPREGSAAQGLAKPGARPLGNEPRAEVMKRAAEEGPAPATSAETNRASERKETKPAPKDAPTATEDVRAPAPETPRKKTSVPTTASDAVSRVKAKVVAPAVPEPKQEKTTVLTPPASTPKVPAGARALVGGSDSVPMRAALPERTRRVAAVREDATADADAAIARVCGTVEDHAGRPIAGARVVLVEQGESVATDEAGRYCLDAPPGQHALAVFAIGFDSMRRDVRNETGATDADFVLTAVHVMDKMYAYRGAEPDPFGAWPDSAKAPARRAAERARLAANARSAMLFDQAGEDWERAVLATIGSAVEARARFALAEARVSAWEIDPTDERRRAARTSLETYLARAPRSPERDVASRWLERVKR